MFIKSAQAKLLSVAVASALALGASTAYATQSEGGFSIGVKGGYKDIDIPTSSLSGSIDGKTLSLSSKIDKYVGNIHAGYLWPVADVFQLGGQVGYSYYGQYKLTGTFDGASASIKTTYSSVNLEVVGQWNIQSWFVQLRAGGGYFMQNASDSGAFGNTDHSRDNKWAPIAGVSGGYFFTDNFSGEVFYDHVFGTNYNSTSVLSADKPATMNMVGVGLTYSF